MESVHAELLHSIVYDYFIPYFVPRLHYNIRHELWVIIMENMFGLLLSELEDVLNS